MKDKKKAPKLRFKGFTDDWEQRKLGDVADITTGSRNHQDSVTDGKYPFFVRSDKVERLNEYDFDTRAILVPGDGRIGEIFHYYNGKFALHQRVYKVDNFNGINALFLLGQFKYSFKKHALRLNAQGTVPSLRLQMFTNWNISIPNITEQERIGSFFRKLDQTITLHEEKKRQLERLKSALLQKMFAYKNKSGDPDVRFKGFDERWERHMLNDLAIFNPKGTLPTSFEYVDLGSVIGVEMISHKTISKFDAPSRAQRLAQVGDLFYQTVRPYQQNNYLFDNKDNAYVFSTGYAQLRPLIDGYFLLCLVQTKSFVRKVMNACTGTSYPAINSQDLAQIGVNIPINSKEQRLIGNLYKVIDNLIMLYQQKLDDLNTIKQSLLQKMFI
ncbi:restriction endonuclease subunit S [Lactobacillus delbrueckii subsp. lactis]|uniref:restriction endonuclease subunit S n=1 Tax=Lactobacillus delbrueckii TaxID=1584 RepID=UPI001E3B3F88|nr:restriction endonuclease subunit S [Lactobacillus delbrueckii]MCD5599090.1 restriction endonuclease subunit S [Lactobacillus delbrueckii subsp. lactis]